LEHLSEQGIWHLAVPLTARQDETTPDDVTENQLGGSPVRGKTIRYSPEILEGMAGLSLLVRGILRLFNDTADTLDGKEPTVQLRQVRGNTVLNSLPLWINNLKHLKLNSSDGERELEYDLRIDSNPLLVVDDFLFREVLQNLVRNASDAMGDVAKAPATGWKPGICIHLLETSSESPEQAVILVSDTGTGIPRDRWDTLFVARKSTKVDATQGAAHMGEGMATCKALMALMGGDIEIVKPEEGYKTTFKLTLKTASHSEEVPPEPLAEPPIESEANRVIIDRVFEVRQILDEIKPYNDPFKRVLQNCATILGRRIGAIPIVPQAMPPTGERKYWRDDWEKLIECALKKDAQGVSETCRKIAQTIPDEDRQGDTPLINRFRRGFKKAIELVIGDPDSFIKIVESSRDLILQKMQP
jgi:hypothetical protein